MNQQPGERSATTIVNSSNIKNIGYRVGWQDQIVLCCSIFHAAIHCELKSSAQKLQCTSAQEVLGGSLSQRKISLPLDSPSEIVQPRCFQRLDGCHLRLTKLNNIYFISIKNKVPNNNLSKLKHATSK